MRLSLTTVAAVAVLWNSAGISRCQFVTQWSPEEWMHHIRLAQATPDELQLAGEVIDKLLGQLQIFDADFVSSLLVDGGNPTTRQFLPAVTRFLCKEVNHWAGIGLNHRCVAGMQDYFCALMDWTEAVATDCQQLNNTAECTRCQRRKAAATTLGGLWPWRGLDVIGKMPPFLRSGNFFWTGGYEMCKAIDVTIDPGPDLASRKLQGQYCYGAFGVDALLMPKPNGSASLMAAALKRFDANVGFKGVHLTAGGGGSIPGGGGAGGNTSTNPCPGGGIGEQIQTIFTENNIPLPVCAGFPLRIGFCMPKGCTSEDASLIAKTILPGVCFAVCVDQEGWTIAGMLILALVLLIVLTVTLAAAYDLLLYQPSLHRIEQSFNENTATEVWRIDGGLRRTTFHDPVDIRRSIANAKRQYYNKLSVISRLALCMSLYSNGRRLFSTNISPDAIPCLNGIRVLGMGWVVLGHTYVFSLAQARNVVTAIRSFPGEFLFQIVNNGTPSVDVFFTLSGCLLTYLFLLNANKTGGKQLKKPGFWITYYVHRYIRLTPLYGMVILLGSVVYPNLGSGPYWDGFESMLTKTCAERWWQNLLYISNFVGDFTENCISWSWYLSNDMQMYMVAPVILILLWAFPLGGVSLTVLLAVASMLARGIVTRIEDYGPTVIIPVKDPNGYQTRVGGLQNTLYVKPWMRCGPFLVGMLCGYLLIRLKRTASLHKLVALLLWLFAFGLMAAVVFGLYPYVQTGDYHPTIIAFYAAAHRTAFGLAIAIIIGLCATGNGGPINSFLSWSLFGPLSRLTYAAYLVHEFVIHAYFTMLRKPFYAEHSSMVIYFLGSWFVTYLAAVVVSLLFEAPVIQLEKLLFTPAKATADTPAPKQRSVATENGSLQANNSDAKRARF